MSLSLPHPSPLQEGLQANSLLIPLYLLSPYHPMVRGPCSIFSLGSRSHKPQDPGGIFLEGAPKSYQILEFTSNSSSHLSKLRSPGSQASWPL